MDESTERQSARRIASASDRRRRLVERAIHDGVQQHLALVGLKLSLLREDIGRDPIAAERRLAEVLESVSAAQREMRELAHAVYPAALENAGLIPALTELTGRPPLNLELRANGVARHSTEIETAIYFCCLEAVKNVELHAGSARAVMTVSEHNGVISFEVRDDGGGFEPHQDLGFYGGLQHIADRLSALGGYLELESAPGRGATVRGSIPLKGEAGAAFG